MPLSHQAYYEETRLQVIAVSENFFDPQVEWFKVGDVLGRFESGGPHEKTALNEGCFFCG